MSDVAVRTFAALPGPRPEPARGDGVPEFLSEEQLAEFLGIPCVHGHIANLRKKQALPHLQWQVGGEVIYTYPRDLVRAWALAKASRGRRRAGDC